MPLKTAKAAQKPVKEFLPSSFKLQLEKEAHEAEQRKKMSDGPGRYLRAPKEETNDKGKVIGPGSVEFRVLSEAVFGFSLWYETDEGGRSCMRWLSQDLLDRGIEGGNIPEDEIPAKCERFPKSKKPKITKCLSMVIYNITESSETDQHVFQIWDLDKATMIDQFASACNSPNFGHPSGYDFIWTRTGQLQETKHTLQPQPPYELPQDILDAYAALEVNLQAHAAGAPIDEVWGDIEKRED
jgi:hypothetical protein